MSAAGTARAPVRKAPRRGVSLPGVIGIAVILLIMAVGVRVSAGPHSSNGQSGGAFTPADPNGHTVTVDLTATETDQTIVKAATGVEPVNYHVWTFDGTAPGPVIRVNLGDTVKFTLKNASTMGMQHSIDFHAAMTPWANLPSPGQTTLTGNYQPVNPGETKTFTWLAQFPGVFMYHCGAQPVLEHIANGMYGAIIVEPDNIPKEREYTLVQSEFYPADTPTNGVFNGDFDKMVVGDPKYVVWNGVADQYKAAPLEVRPNEPFRIWVVNAGPTLTSAFHVIGTMFNTYADGNPANVIYGDQTYNIPPGGAAMFELNIPDPGLYPFVTHSFAYTGRGAVGLIKVDASAPAAPGSYPAMSDPFSAGVNAFSMPAAVTQAESSPAPTTAGSPAMSPGAAASASPSVAASGAAGCNPTGSTIHLAAQNTAFDTDCIAAKAGQDFEIKFVNKDSGIPHNVSIYADSSASKQLYKGKIITGPSSVTYKVPALKTGSYYFRCDIHPTQMFGTLTIQ